MRMRERDAKKIYCGRKSKREETLDDDGWCGSALP
jgi:hypothetical protein